MLRPYIISLRAPTTIPQSYHVRIPRPPHSRQPQRKCAPPAWYAVHLDAPSLQLRQQPRDREPQPRAPQLAAARLVDAKEPIEDAIQVLRRDAGARVAHADADLPPVTDNRECHRPAR